MNQQITDKSRKVKSLLQDVTGIQNVINANTYQDPLNSTLATTNMVIETTDDLVFAGMVNTAITSGLYATIISECVTAANVENVISMVISLLEMINKQLSQSFMRLISTISDLPTRAFIAEEARRILIEIHKIMFSDTIAHFQYPSLNSFAQMTPQIAVPVGSAYPPTSMNHYSGAGHHY